MCKTDLPKLGHFCKHAEFVGDGSCGKVYKCKKQDDCLLDLKFFVDFGFKKFHICKNPILEKGKNV